MIIGWVLLGIAACAWVGFVVTRSRAIEAAGWVLGLAAGAIFVINM